MFSLFLAGSQVHSNGCLYRGSDAVGAVVVLGVSGNPAVGGSEELVMRNWRSFPLVSVIIR